MAHHLNSTGTSLPNTHASTVDTSMRMDTAMASNDQQTDDQAARALEEMSILTPEWRQYFERTPLGRECRSWFYLDSDTIFLNHNAYGATAKPVLQAQAQYVNQMERNPDRFLRREKPRLLRQATTKLADFVRADPDDLVFVTNATTGINSVLFSLDLQEGDEVLCLNLTYPAVLNTLRHICFYTQEFVELKVVDIHLPLSSCDELIEQIKQAITPNTRLAVLDHIASCTGFVVPLEELIPIFHANNIPVLVDGASAPGQLPLQLRDLGADFYVGNCYKWMMSSKSCAFLYVSKEFQNTVRPVVTSLGYGQGFIEEFSVQGTRDEASFLSLVTALDFYESVGVERVFAHNKSLIDWASNYLAEQWGTDQLLPPCQRAPFVSLVRMPLNWPTIVNEMGETVQMSESQVNNICEGLVNLLMDRFHVTVRVSAVQGNIYVRISAQMYNERKDFEALAKAVLDLVRAPTMVDQLAQMNLQSS